MSSYHCSHTAKDGSWPVVKFTVKASTLAAAVTKAKRKVGVGRALIVKNNLGERHTEET